MSNIVTELESLERQFSKYDKLKIPLYQRSYAWGGDEVQVFWQDIRESIDEGRANYFIGPIVSKTIGEKEVEIIDGQQRLTTSLVLLSIIRRLCLFMFHEDREKNEEYHKFYTILKQRFEVTGSLLAENGANRYVMNEENNYIYNSFIVTDTTRDEIEREKKKYKKHDSNYKLLDCIDNAWGYVERYCGDEKELKTLKEIAVYLLEKLQILNISVSDESDAYLIFETINDRGRELDTMDLVKNLLFSKVSGSSFERVKNNWIRMQEHLSDMNSANDFLYNFWTVHKGRTSKQSLFTQIREFIRNGSSSAVEFSNDITQAARLYSAINNPSDALWNDYNKETTDNLQVLKVLSAKVVHPIIMAAQPVFDISEFNKLLKYLIVFQVRYVYVSDKHTGRYSTAISTIPNKIKNGELTKAIKVAKALKAENIYVSDQEFSDSFKYLTCNTKKAKYLLSAIEEFEAGILKKINADGLVVNIEHVLPQEQCASWSNEATNIEAQEYSTWANRLGNMVLSCTKLNKEAARKPFKEKKVVLIEASKEFATTFNIKEEPNWTKEKIQARQDKLAEKAIDVWKISFS
ncbi:DUF262 domain-containing protein [Alteromonas sp. BMJM2]|uniref:DUF262 domain-containing protein n=1 Tax=Alteromonas sp. BMJM2 TaxID=2954241 RepID=UPI0022B5DD52|nr:DUF262 domain-containing HNH endonuclease family protein [Alteromonas sp. BMJM2]